MEILIRLGASVVIVLLFANSYSLATRQKPIGSTRVKVVASLTIYFLLACMVAFFGWVAAILCAVLAAVTNLMFDTWVGKNKDGFAPWPTQKKDQADNSEEVPAKD